MSPFLRAVHIMCFAGMLVEPASSDVTRDPTPRQLAQQGKTLLDSGNLGGALASLGAAREKLQREPDGDIELADYLALQLYNLGVRFNNASDAPHAIACFTEILKTGGKEGRIRDAAFRRTLGESTLDVAAYLTASGKPDLTLEAYGLLASIMPNDVRVQTGLGMAHLARGDYKEALASLRRAEREQPDSVEVASGLGRAALAMARSAPPVETLPLLEKATDWFRRACTLDPSSASRQRELASALILRSQTAGRSGDLAVANSSAMEAESVLRGAVTLEPESVWVRVDLAALLLRARRYREAVPVLTTAVEMLDGMLGRDPGDRNAAVWRESRASCLQNRAIASFNLAVDALNRAEFDQVEKHLVGICELSVTWRENCASLRQAGLKRQNALREIVAAHEKNLASSPHSASDLLALGDLYAGLGQYDKALVYYGRLDKTNRTPEVEERLADVAAPGPLVEHLRRVQTAQSHVDLRSYTGTPNTDFETALKAAWLRVTTAMGTDSMRGPLLVTLYPNRRAFRELAGYRVGGMVKGNYSPGQVSLFMRPGQTTVEWVSVLTHEMTHHAVEKLSGGGAPRWLSEGVARWVEGDAAIIDRGRVRLRLSTNSIRTLRSIDETMDRFWNDPVEILDGRDIALLAVEEIVKHQGADGLKRILAALAVPGADIDAAMLSVIRMDRDGVDAAWRTSIRSGR